MPNEDWNVSVELVKCLSETVQFINSYLCVEEPLEKGIDDLSEDFIQDETDFLFWLAKI